MPKLNDLAGAVFGRLRVLARSGTSKNKKAIWECACSCGETIKVVGTDLISGHTSSCGCYRAERNKTSSLSHGMRRSPTYSSWEAMKTRCGNPKSVSFADYGAKWITVCERWKRSFVDFLQDMGERPTGTTLDRIDNSKGYEPGNCRWATKTQQQRNTTANMLITFNGETMTQAEWADRQGVRQATLSARLRAGWSVRDALTLKPRLGLKRMPARRRADGKFGDEVEAIEGGR